MIGVRSDGPAYHPPRLEVVEDAGVKVVVSTRFVQGPVTRRGANWTYQVEAFRLADGERHAPGPASTLPQPVELYSR